nr:MAG TPA: hypothetical protein [Caudoviricetes sp.]
MGVLFFRQPLRVARVITLLMRASTSARVCISAFPVLLSLYTHLVIYGIFK